MKAKQEDFYPQILQIDADFVQARQELLFNTDAHGWKAREQNSGQNESPQSK